jgi:hypothetical protein
MKKKVLEPELSPGRSFSALASVFVAAFGVSVLAWVSWLTIHDVLTWGKDLSLIFFGSRAGEAISLGIGMTVIHYLLLGAAFLLFGVFIYTRNRTKSPRLSFPQPPQKKQKKAPTRPPKKAQKQTKPETQEWDGSSGCPQHFGYLKTRPKDALISQECLICRQLGACLVGKKA